MSAADTLQAVSSKDANNSNKNRNDDEKKDEEIKRLEWQKGSQCLIYSRTKNEWSLGVIHDIYMDDADKEWFIVKYGDKKKKSIQRFSEALKPLSTKYETTKYQDDDEKKQDDNIIYIPSDINLGGNENNGDSNEKILFGKSLKDRRKKIISSQDERIIVQCIGRLVTDYGHTDEFGRKFVGCGTGTVFDYDDKTKNVYVITCAHNIVEEDEGDINTPKSVLFRRIITMENDPPKIVAEYACFIDENRYHEKYRMKSPDSNDLAVLVFKDDGFYENIFKNNKDVIQLISSNGIDNKQIYEYSIYGYPCNADKDSKVSKAIRDEMWGMTASSNSKICINDQNIEMYVTHNAKKKMFFYNAIDSEGGQSGSAIFINIEKDKKYGIVGIHTGGSKIKGKNWGVALNNDKLNWI